MRTISLSLGAAVCAALLAGPSWAAPEAVEWKVAAAAPSGPSGAGPEGSRELIFKSTYTDLDLDQCETVDRSADDEEGPGWAHWRCKGLNEDWPVHVMAGDLRYAVSYGENAVKERAGGTYFRRFTRLHDTVEWVQHWDEESRTLTPVATILRFYLTVEARERKDGKAYDHPVLVVTQLKPGAVCHVAYVDARANENANEDARTAAVELTSALGTRGPVWGTFDCARKPELVGPQTPGILAE